METATGTGMGMGMGMGMGANAALDRSHHSCDSYYLNSKLSIQDVGKVPF